MAVHQPYKKAQKSYLIRSKEVVPHEAEIIRLIFNGFNSCFETCPYLLRLRVISSISVHTHTQTQTAQYACTYILNKLKFTNILYLTTPVRYWGYKIHTKC